MAAIGIVAVSLVSSGGITWWLMSRLVSANVNQQLTASAIAYANTVRTAQNRYDQSAFLDLMSQRAFDPGQQGDRLLLLGGGDPPAVVFDNAGKLPPGEAVALPPNSSRTVSRVLRLSTGRVPIAGRSYQFAAVHLPAGRYVSWVVVARPEEAVFAQTSAQLIPLLLGSGGAALALAIVVSVVLARALTQPLQELRRAAEALGAGTLMTRVNENAPGEVGVVARAFNRMATAVEKARQQQRDFLADVSHELKTPLTSLIGFSQALVDGSLRTGEESQRAALIVNEEAQRVLHLAQELLDLARAEAGQIQYQVQAVDLGAQLQQEVEVARPRAEQRRLELRVDIPLDLVPIKADPDRLHQVLGNLVDNAVKYAPEGSMVEIAAQVNDGQVVTEVRNPVGAHTPDVERMFDRFYRADRSRASTIEGVGLGLAISRQMAAAQGGQLTAYINGSHIHLRLAMPRLD